MTFTFCLWVTLNNASDYRANGLLTQTLVRYTDNGIRINPWLDSCLLLGSLHVLAMLLNTALQCVFAAPDCTP